VRSRLRAATALLLLALVPGRALALPAEADRNHDGRVVIACLGDSNTDPSWQQAIDHGFPGGRGWCEQLGERFDDPRVAVVNLGIGGATAIDHVLPESLEARVLFGGASQLEFVLEKVPADVVIFAFGTNDLLPEHDATPSLVVATYERLWRRASSRGMLALVATTPGVLEHKRKKKIRRNQEGIAETNRLLREAFPSRHLLRFDEILSDEDYLDDLHMNGSGQQKRADEAYARIIDLLAATPVNAGVRALEWKNGHWIEPEPRQVPPAQRPPVKSFRTKPKPHEGEALTAERDPW